MSNECKQDCDELCLDRSRLIFWAADLETQRDDLAQRLETKTVQLDYAVRQYQATRERMMKAEAQAKEWESAYMEAMKRGDEWKAKQEETFAFYEDLRKYHDAMRLERDALAQEVVRLRAEREAWPVKIFHHKYLDPNCVENGCQSLLLEEAERRGANEMLDRVRASLEMYPHGGGDSVVMAQVERIIKDENQRLKSELEKVQDDYETDGEAFVAAIAENQRLRTALQGLVNIGRPGKEEYLSHDAFIVASQAWENTRDLLAALAMPEQPSTTPNTPTADEMLEWLIVNDYIVMQMSRDEITAMMREGK